MLLISLLQDINIEEKIKDAPDNDYSIGILIGSLLPFVILVTLAYLFYRYNQKNKPDF